MANKPYQEGAVWSFRLRIKDQSIYRTGFVSAAEARREAERLRQKILEAGKPKHAGPWRTTLADAMQQYALERLPSLKGARQEANRINCYLRAANLDIIKIAKPLPYAAVVPWIYWDVSLEPGKQPRKIPNSLHAHRRRQEDGSVETQRLIIMTYQAQDLVDVMLREGYEPATITLERALLRQMFNYPRKTWNWVEPARNPATQLKMPTVDNARDRMLTNKEWRMISSAIEKSLNPYAAPAIAVLLEMAMRVSESLLNATWANVDWNRCLLRFLDAKEGARDVPLNPAAMTILATLNSLRAEGDPDPRILPISYEALRAVWNRVRVAVGIEDIRFTS